MKKLVLTLFVAATLAGCDQNETVQTVDWYKAHDAERTAMVSKCRNNPGESDASPNCINAITAQNHLTVEKREYTKHEPINVLEGGK